MIWWANLKPVLVTAMSKLKDNRMAKQRMFIDCHDALLSAIGMDRPCAVVAMAGCGVAFYDTSPLPHDDVCDEWFVAVGWLGRYAGRVRIGRSARPVQSAEGSTVLSQPPLSASPLPAPTRRAEYIDKVRRLADSLKQTHGKTVVSTVDVVRDVAGDPLRSALHYLDKADGSLNRSLFYLPGQGCWVVASPEVFIQFERSTGIVSTMALAGTRPFDAVGLWDNKNLEEQRFVSDHIESCLAGYCTDVDIMGPHTVAAGNVQHICTVFNASLESDNFEALADALNPTPAVCGTPVGQAIQEISEIEQHRRGMYGGYFGIETRSAINLAVTLRCARLSSHSACIYAGGGITADSNAGAEWLESRIKGEPLRRAFSGRAVNAEQD